MPEEREVRPEEPATGAAVNLQLGNLIPGSASFTIQAAGSLQLGDLTFNVDPWYSSTWAPEWFRDALNEARRQPESQPAGRNARRREILFAVCCAESYLLEWVRDEVLQGNYVMLGAFFPPGKKRGVTEKWRDIPRLLHKLKLISGLPDFGGKHGDRWQTLVAYRDGFVHAAASRPSTRFQSAGEKPVPPLGALDALEPGWAVRIVVERIRLLHRAVGTTPPPWPVDP
jgi:hypothetical protein